jgi:uncharacterized membrane protein YsdA (DUF1294 family)/cold shock CspA family protein
MRQAKPPRYQGKISSWKDEQGFGFIAQNGGGPGVFFHIKAFTERGIRPAPGDLVTYQLGVNDKGQPRAERVALVRKRSTPARDTSGPGSGSPLIAFGFFAVLGIAVVLGKLPPQALGLYAGASLAAFLAYGLDKSAARNGRWRTKESTLHLLALVGGWPGALLAQRVYRHKSKKREFQVVFWATVLVNCGVLGWTMLPASVGSSTLAIIG